LQEERDRFRVESPKHLFPRFYLWKHILPLKQSPRKDSYLVLSCRAVNSIDMGWT